VERMEDAIWRVRLPMVSLKRIAGMAAVDPVSGVVSAIARARLKMVKRQRCADVSSVVPQYLQRARRQA
jgi:hypothetical protein